MVLSLYQAGRGKYRCVCVGKESVEALDRSGKVLAKGNWIRPSVTEYKE